jgi:hypothetical protein
MQKRNIKALKLLRGMGGLAQLDQSDDCISYDLQTIDLVLKPNLLISKVLFAPNGADQTTFGWAKDKVRAIKQCTWSNTEQWLCAA